MQDQDELPALSSGFLTALFGFCRSDLGKCWQKEENISEKVMHGSNSEQAKWQKTLYSYGLF